MKKFSFVIFIILAFSIVLVAQYKKHTVVKGECLWFIAGDYYNDPFLWPVIYEANKDSIADPHWIYPGEVFVIPNVPAEQVSKPPVQEGIVMEVKGTKTSLEEDLKTAKGTKYERREKIGEAALFSVVKAEDYAFTKKAALIAGFITKDRSIGIGRINKLIKDPPELKHSSTVLGDEVWLNRGASDGIEVGNVYVIFRWGGRVGFYGNIVRIKGVLKILEVEENISTARVTESYEKIEKGDYIMEYTSPDLVIGDAQPAISDIEGKIIAFKNKEDIIKPFSVVYIEPGSGSVQLGDVFLIYKEAPGNLIIPLGQIQIVDVREETASGYITSIMGKTEISNGNKIRLVGRIGG